MTHPLGHTRFIKALKRQPVDRPPIWLMRQAGRYLPEYRAIRKTAGSFLNMSQSADLATTVTLQPLERFPLDAAIIFSDILVVPMAMGMSLSFVQGEGPKFADPIQTEADLARLHAVDPQLLQPGLDAIRQVSTALGQDTPLIGFCGSPWTVATYMVEGGSSKDFARVKHMAYANPQLFDALLNHLVEGSIEWLTWQVEHGASVLQLFDSWGGALPHDLFERCSLAPMRRIVTALKTNPVTSHVPVTVFTKGGGQWLPALVGSGADCLGLDWTTSLRVARQQVKDKVALQGNLDPAWLRASPEQIQAATQAVLADYGQGPGHVFNLGHGMPLDIDPERVAAVVETVTSWQAVTQEVAL